jgi:hypothetical protein
MDRGFSRAATPVAGVAAILTVYVTSVVAFAHLLSGSRAGALGGILYVTAAALCPVIVARRARGRGARISEVLRRTALATLAMNVLLLPVVVLSPRM